MLKRKKLKKIICCLSSRTHCFFSCNGSVDSERQKQEDYGKSLRNENKDLKFEVGDLQKSTKEKDSEISKLQNEVNSLKDFISELEKKNMGLQENVKTTTASLEKSREEIQVCGDRPPFFVA